MDRPAFRRLNLSDLAILIAATSVGAWIVRVAHEGRVQRLTVASPTLWSWKIGLEVAPFLLTTSAGLLVTRLLEPRPSTRESLRQPGVIASLAIFVGTAVGALLRVGHSWISGLRGFGITYSIDAYLALAMGTGELVAASWATLALVGAWQPGSDWVDRAGRILGVFAIVLWLTSGLSL